MKSEKFLNKFDLTDRAKSIYRSIKREKKRLKEQKKDRQLDNKKSPNYSSKDHYLRRRSRVREIEQIRDDGDN